MSTPLSTPLSLAVEGTPVEEDTSNAASFGDSASSTDSVSDSIRQYREVHGRTYHNYGATEYWGANDKEANEQLDIGHHMWTLVLESKLYLAPLDKEKVHKVIDVGTGTGIWAIDFADEHPAAAITGTDLSPIQPSWIPPNLKFEIDDAQLEWAYGNDVFDFIHIRNLGGSIANWPLLYSRAFAATTPGGYIEQYESNIDFLSDDNSLQDGDIMPEWSKIFIGAGEKMGQVFTIGEKAKTLMEEAGFLDVVEKRYKVPVGPWMGDTKGKELGRWSLLYLEMGLESMALYMLIHVLGWKYEEVQVLLAKMRKALVDKKNHAYFEV